MNHHANPNPKKNQPSLSERFMKQLRSNRTTRILCVTLVLLLAVLTVAVSVTVAANRAKKPPKTVETDPPIHQQETDAETDPPAPQETETNPPKPAETDPKPVLDEIPDFTLPVSGVLSASHNAELQVYSTTMKDYRVHIGVDMSTAESAPVYAAADGTVAKIWEDPLMGQCLALRHKGDCMTVYKNLAKDLPAGIEEGSTVSGGQLLATVGDTAMVEAAEEPHLHFEMTVAGIAVDPLNYFDENALTTLKLDAVTE